MERKRYAWVVISVLAISLSIGLLVASAFSDLPGSGREVGALMVKSTVYYPAYGEAINSTGKFKMGISDNPDAIDFGRITIGGQVRKSLVVMNPTTHWSKVKFYAFGNISRYMHIGHWINGEWHEESSVLLPPKTKKYIEIGFKPPAVGNYTGTVAIVSMVPRQPIDSIMWLV